MNNTAIAKLTHEQRCEIMAFLMCGVPHVLLADVFGVTTRTIRNIERAGGERYQRVYAGIVWEGSKRDFCAKYITDDRAEAIRDYWPQLALPPVGE